MCRRPPPPPPLQEYFGSIEYQASSLGRGVPGPGHYDAAALDHSHAALSTHTVRSVSLRGRTAFDGSLASARGRDVPGPGHYPLGNGSFTSREQKPQTPALKSRTELVTHASHSIGPGEHFAALQQDRALSGRGSQRSILFGSAAPRRNSLPASLAESAGRGPGRYFEGLNADTKLSTAPQSSLRYCSLGAKYRPPPSAVVDAAPQTPPDSIGPQFLSTKRTAPAPAMKGRTRFGSMYDV